jgi:hypothetical protein
MCTICHKLNIATSHYAYSAGSPRRAAHPEYLRIQSLFCSRFHRDLKVATDTSVSDHQGSGGSDWQLGIEAEILRVVDHPSTEQKVEYKAALGSRGWKEKAGVYLAKLGG